MWNFTWGNVPIYITCFVFLFQGVTAFKPLFRSKKTVVTVDLFEPLTLRCHARAEPTPLYEWSRNGTIGDGKTSIKNGVVTHSNHVTLALRNVTWEDRGSYFCNAWNSEGYEYKEFEVVVNRKYLRIVKHLRGRISLHRNIVIFVYITLLLKALTSRAIVLNPSLNRYIYNIIIFNFRRTKSSNLFCSIRWL